MATNSKESSIRHISYGKVYFDQGKIKEALEEFRVALIHDPENPNCLKSMGRCLFELGSLREAADTLERAVTLRPEFPDLHYDLGCVYIKLNFLDRAATEFKEALNINPRYEAARQALIDLKSEEKRAVGEDFAKKLLHSSDREKSAKQAMVHLNLADALAQRNLLREAAAELREAIAVKPNYPDIRNKMGEVYLRMRDFKSAEQEFREALRINPNYYQAELNLAETFRLGAEEQLLQAERHYRNVYEKNPENHTAKVGLERINFIKNLDIA